MVRGNGIDARLYISQIPQEQLRHVGIDAFSVWHSRIGVYATSRLWLFSLAYGIGELTKHKTVADIPGNSWNLSYTIGDFRDGSRDFRRHPNNS